MRAKIKVALRWVLAIVMVAIGVGHFVDPRPFVSIMPPWVPWHLAMVYISGVFEVLGGLGLLPKRSRNAAGWGLIALYIAVFPANLHMAINDVGINGEPIDTWILWARLPMQGVAIAWAYWVSRPDDT